MKLVMGILCYARPLHTALTLAYAYANKAVDTDLHFFYGIPESGEHKSPSLRNMLNALAEQGHGEMHYLPEDGARNTGGNVDNLMETLNALEGYDCYFKIDDDVIIGPRTDEEMADLLLRPEMEAHKVYILTAQAVREHMQGPKAFGWDFKLGNRMLVCRRRGQSPMETYAAVSYKMLPHLENAGLRPKCENDAGTFSGFAIKLWNTGAKAALVLYPHVIMQHIGLTCTTGLKAIGVGRSWAPAKSWSPAGRVIQVPYFDFNAWERSHANGTQKEAAQKMIDTLMTCTKHPAVKLIRDELDKYTPGVGDVDLPTGRADPGPPRNRVTRRNRRKRVTVGRGRV